jgi:hypothetical protein
MFIEVGKAIIDLAQEVDALNKARAAARSGAQGLLAKEAALGIVVSELICKRDTETKAANTDVYGRIPARIREALVRYVELRLRTGDFLYAVLTNDLFAAIARADDECLRALPAIVAWIHNKTPCSCHGSPACVSRWLRKEEAEKVE